MAPQRELQWLFKNAQQNYTELSSGEKKPTVTLQEVQKGKKLEQLWSGKVSRLSKLQTALPGHDGSVGTQKPFVMSAAARATPSSS